MNPSFKPYVFALPHKLRQRRQEMGKLVKSAVSAVMAAVLFSGAEALAVAPESLIPMGDVAGISIASRGAVVVSLEQIETENGLISPAGDAGIKPGDVIIKINSQNVESAIELKTATAELGGEMIAILVERGGEELQFALKAETAEDGTGELGVWLRDTLTGMGTITFYDPGSGVFGALGHPVSDIDTGIVLPLRKGIIMNACVTGVVSGQNGAPGRLCGELDFTHDTGIVTENTDVGIYGISSKLNYDGRRALQVAGGSEIRLGTAVIMSGALGKVEEYSVEITRVYSGGGSRDMMIKITDERLLNATGGIVQGMSGSPVIQNGKIIGAVTHVLISDPTRGYGVSIEDMLEKAFAEAKDEAA